MFDSLKKKIGSWFKKEEGLKEFGEEGVVKEKKKQKVSKKIKIRKKEVDEEKPEELKKALEKKKKAEEEKRRKEEEEKRKEEEEKPEEDRAVEELAEEEGGDGFFSKLARKITTSKLEEEDFDEFFDEFEMVLLENNVALEVVDKIRDGLKNSLVGKQFKKSEVKEQILNSLKRAIGTVLVEGEDILEKIKNRKSDEPYVILFFGINGSGKTTTVAKLAWKIKREGFSVVLAAADTFRAASIEQLQKHGENLNVEVIKSEYGADPASVAFDAIQHAKKHKKDVVLIDTAGRMYTKSNLMREMEKIARVAKPDLKIFVGESITGNDATEQAKMFDETAGIDGIILSKADVDEKSGTILSVGYVTGKPIFYLGTGQEYKDLERFSKENVLKGLGLE